VSMRSRVTVSRQTDSDYWQRHLLQRQHFPYHILTFEVDAEPCELRSNSAHITGIQDLMNLGRFYFSFNTAESKLSDRQECPGAKIVMGQQQHITTSRVKLPE
jgi:hypothetical protein